MYNGQYIPDLSERSYEWDKSTKRQKRYYDDEHDEIYLGKYDEGNEQTEKE